MQRSFFTRSCVGAVLAALATTTAAAAAPAHDAARGRAAAKPRCTSTQAPFTVLGTTRCRPRGEVAPQARKGDARLLFLRSAVSRDLSGIRDQRGRKIPVLWAGAGARTRAAIASALPGVLAGIDKLRGATAATARLTQALQAPCGRSAPRSGSATFGAVKAEFSSDGTATLSTGAGGGQSLAATLDIGNGCPAVTVPACPMADGALDASGTRQWSIALKLTRSGRLVRATSFTAAGRQTLGGTVADDAKLRSLLAADDLREVAAIQGPGYSGKLRLRLTRRTGVDMRTKDALDGESAASVRLTLDHLKVANLRALAARSATAHAATFSALVSDGISTSSQRQRDWQLPGSCASLAFTPETDTLVLDKSTGGSITARVVAKAGGTPTKVRWTRVTQTNATFSPQTSSTATPTFNWTLSGGGGSRVAAEFRATSPAGVASGSWQTQSPPTDAYYVVDSGSYAGAHSASRSAPGECDVSGSSTDSVSVTSVPFNATMAQLLFSSGEYKGGINVGVERPIGRRSSTVTGCDPTNGARPACTFAPSGFAPMSLNVLVTIKKDSPTADVSWTLPTAIVGATPYPDNCYAPPIVGPTGLFQTTEPRATFLTPGSHTITAKRFMDYSNSTAALTETVSGEGTGSITFHRVTVDGSPYDG